MNDYVRDAIVKLKGDAVGVEFTGFVSNARLPSPPALEGEIWHHIHADTSGRYADGHRIKTSPIVEIHAVGNSLWVETEAHSRYGILSFAPLGWIYFSRMYRTTDRLDPMPDGIPIFDMSHLVADSRMLVPGISKRFLERRVKPECTISKFKSRVKQHLRPALDQDYLTRMNDHAEECREVLKRGGVRLINHE